jgi:hypothetical protein
VYFPSRISFESAMTSLPYGESATINICFTVAFCLGSRRVFGF